MDERDVNLSQISTRVVGFTLTDDDGDEIPGAVLAFREDAPVIDATAARDSWNQQLLPLLDSHIYRLREHLKDADGVHDDFKPVTGFTISTPFLQMMVVSAHCPDMVEHLVDGLNMLRKYADSRVTVWATSAANFTELDALFDSVLNEEQQ